jgi:hypothetical protein
MKLTSGKHFGDIYKRIDAIRQDSNILSYEKWRQIGKEIINDLHKRGKFFNTPQGLFYFDSEHRQAFSLDEDVGLAAIINSRYGINPEDHGFGRVWADMQTHAFLNGQKAEIRRLAHYDTASKQLYISQFNGCMYRLDGDSVSSVPNGSDGMFFFEDRKCWEPYGYTRNAPKGEFDRQLINSVNFTDSILSPCEQRRLLKLWVLAVFFGSVQPTKIILLLLGDYGAGKTSALRRIQKLIFGRKADLLSVEKDRQDGFIATITTDPLALFDNLDERISWLPYNLSRLATGVTFSRRQLYSTNTKVEFPGVSWLAITARTVRFMEEQPDLPDRTLVLRLERLREMQPEQELLEAVAQHRNALWSELLDELNRVVRHLRDSTEPVRVHFRMADFAAFALRVATIWGCRPEIEQVFAKLKHAQAELVFEDEPINQVMELWLRDQANHGRLVDAGTLQSEWTKIASQQRISWPLDNPRTLGQRLGQLKTALQQKFDVEITQDAHTKQNSYRFWPKGGRDRAATQAPAA